MQHHGINPNKHYLNYPEEEEEDDEDNETSSSDEEEQDSNTNQNESDLNNSFDEDNITSGSSLAEVVNRVSETCLEGNVNIQRRQERIDELQEEFKKHQTDAEVASIAKRRKK